MPFPSLSSSIDLPRSSTFIPANKCQHQHTAHRTDSAHSAQRTVHTLRTKSTNRKPIAHSSHKGKKERIKRNKLHKLASSRKRRAGAAKMSRQDSYIRTHSVSMVREERPHNKKREKESLCKKCENNQAENTRNEARVIHNRLTRKKVENGI